jgi:hypothetical protein
VVLVVVVIVEVLIVEVVPPPEEAALMTCHVPPKLTMSWPVATSFCLSGWNR